MLLQGLKYMGTGMGAISLIGAGIGIGLIFSSLLLSYSMNPALGKQLFVYAILGFALTEAIALFGLMICFLILFA